MKESYADLMQGKPSNFSPFRPGMTATVDIITTRKENVVAVPISSVVMRTDTTSTRKAYLETDENEEEANDDAPVVKNDKRYECVFVKEGDKVKLRIVTTGIQDDTYIEVLSGLKKGETIVTGPYTTVSKDLNPGDKVKVKTKAELEKEKKKEKER